MNPVATIFRIDVEPDGFFIDRWKQTPWKGFEGTVDFIDDARLRIAAATGAPAHFTWLFRMDPQIAEVYGRPDWAVTHYPSWPRQFVEDGDEIGLHTHAYRWIAERKRWSLDHANQVWVDHCVRISFDAFRRSFGRDCLSFSFGDRWMNNQTFELIASLGVRYELTVEPGAEERPSYHMNELFTGTLPAYANVPRYPYRPSRRDFRVAGPERTSGPWIIPMSTGYLPRGLIRTFYYAVRDREIRKGEYCTLNPMLDHRAFSTLVHRALAEGRQPFLSLVTRTDAFAEPGSLRNIRRNLDWLLRRPDIGRFRFVTPAEALTLLGLG